MGFGFQKVTNLKQNGEINEITVRDWTKIEVSIGSILITIQCAITSNDGNAARFFNNSAFRASTTDIDEILIIRFAVIVQTLSRGYEVNTRMVCTAFKLQNARFHCTTCIKCYRP